MKKIGLLLLLTAFALWGDVTGKWSGTVSGEFRKGEPDGSQALLVILKQDGGSLTGGIGPDEQMQIPMQKGTAEDDRLKFEVAQGEKGVLYFDLKAKGDEITGEVLFKKNGGDGEGTFKVILKKVADKK